MRSTGVEWCVALVAMSGGNADSVMKLSHALWMRGVGLEPMLGEQLISCEPPELRATRRVTGESTDTLCPKFGRRPSRNGEVDPSTKLSRKGDENSSAMVV